MAVVFEENLNDRDVPLVDGHVKRGLLPSIASVQVDSMLGQQLQDIRLITKAGVVDSPITVLVLYTYMYKQYWILKIYMYMQKAINRL